MIILIDLLATVLIYLFFPVLYLKIKGKVPLKKARKLSIINTIICVAVFEAFQLIVFADDPTYVPNFLPAILYYNISVSMLKERTSAKPPLQKSLHHIDDDDSEEKVEEDSKEDVVLTEAPVEPTHKDNEYETNNEENIMKVGDCIYARTHAELLNELCGTNYKAYMKSSKKLPDGKLLWMIELGDFVSSSGWINKLESSDRISEKHIGDDFSFDKHNTYVNAVIDWKDWDDSDRVVFDIVKTGTSRKYIFRGVFRLNKDECTLNENVWDLILDKYNI